MNEQASAGQGGQPDAHTIALQQLFVKHQTAIKAFILSLQPGFGEADDILQETFLTITRKAADFDEGTQFTSWAFAIARFKLLEARRARPDADELSEATLDALAADAPGAAFFDRRLEALLACIDRLAPRAREIVRLRYHDERGPEEIARQLAWKPNAVNVALSRARIALRDCVSRRQPEGTS